MSVPGRARGGGCVETSHGIKPHTLILHLSSVGGSPATPDRGSIYSLKLSLLVSVLIPLTVVLGAAAYPGYRALEARVETRMQEEVEFVARAIQEPLNRALRQNRPGAVGQLLESAFSLSQVNSVQVYGSDGQEIAVVGDPARPRGEELEEMLARGEEGAYYCCYYEASLSAEEAGRLCSEAAPTG